MDDQERIDALWQECIAPEEDLKPGVEAVAALEIEANTKPEPGEITEPEVVPEPEPAYGSYQAPEAGNPPDSQTPMYYAVPVSAQQAAPPKKKKKKEKKARRGLGVFGAIVLCLICALLGGLFGGYLTVKRIHLPEPKKDTALEVRVEALEEAAKKAPLQKAYDAQQTISTTAVYAQNVSSVVGIINDTDKTNVFGQTTSIASSGSGFVVRADGYIVTNYHVVDGAQTLSVSLYSGEEYPAQVVGYDSDFDVAVLKMEAENLDTASIGDSDLLRVGDQVAAIGNPLGELTLSMTVGYISALDREINTDGSPINMLQTDVAINSGNSGGPLFDMKGNVIGITTAKYSGSTSSGATIEGIGFALPINDVMRIVNDLLELGYVSGRAYLGITAMEMDANTAELYSLPLGVYVSTVAEGSCAQKAGLQKGDIILSLGEHETPSYSALKRALFSYNPGDQTEVLIFRAGAQLTMEITLDERPSDDAIAEQSQETTETPESQTPTTPDYGDDPYGANPYGGMPFSDGDVQDWFRYFFGG